MKNVIFTFTLKIAIDTYMTEYVVASTEFLWKLVVWIVKVLKAIFPETHFFETAK